MRAGNVCPGGPNTHLHGHVWRVGRPGYGPRSVTRRANPRTWDVWGASVSVPGCEAPRHYKTHFQAGQRTYDEVIGHGDNVVVGHALMGRRVSEREAKGRRVSEREAKGRGDNVVTTST